MLEASFEEVDVSTAGSAAIFVANRPKLPA
jgi:hypothetical protein